LYALKWNMRGVLDVGRIDKGAKCNVCGREAVRSLSAQRVKAAGLRVGSEKRAYLCKAHYKEYKKKTKKDKQIEMWRYRG
jgi:thymidine kinase